ncbi:DNA methyltransferase [Hyphomicrobium sp.]|uniref:DNA methyltransferase n=1 Tax=Hyphomicrobium sp. TaxID=82 RepID=UPI0025BA5B5F|nr:DNA methyltransferase [Hyphomicrobium sp.]
MARKRKSDNIGELFIEGGGQLRLVEKSVEQEILEKGKIECLGLTFDSEDERRTHFFQKLREKLADPEFRKTPGFPKGADEDIIRMSDPPWYTACPNPFLADFVRVYGKPYDPKERYERDPFAVDTSVGKTDSLYKAHGYHTKVPHLAIVPSILHYTDPGDIVLDGFAGSGMTGVAAQWCGSAPVEFRKQLEAEWSQQGLSKPKWGPRRVILNDLGPAASFISANYTLPFDNMAFAKAAQRILSETEKELGWMYETLHTDRKTKGRINFTVWSEVFTCPECAGELNFVDEALQVESKKTLDSFPCPHCNATLTKDKLQRVFESSIDAVTGQPHQQSKFQAVFLNYSVGKNSFQKKLDAADFSLIEKIRSLPMPAEMPAKPFPFDDMWEIPRLRSRGITATHHLFLSRQAHALAVLWRKASILTDVRLRNQVLFFIEQAIWGMSILNRYSPSHFSQVNRALTGAYYAASQISEVSPWYILNGKLARLAKQAFVRKFAFDSYSVVSTGTCANLALPGESVDYIFTDPPFGDNYPYAELNFLVEAWHHVFTDSEPEAIVDRSKANAASQKSVNDYQDLMKQCFCEYFRLLKPGRWITIVFSNSRNSVWRAIQEALGTAGFVVADVRTLDKQQLSFKQVTSAAVKQDLVISAYKPTKALTERFALGTSSGEGAWAFVTEHLGHVPVFSSVDKVADVIAERTAQVLHDRMVAFHVQRQLSVPLSTAEFLTGLNQRYPERDGMYFLPTQVAEYDRKRNTAAELRQLSLFVTDEASAIQWVRRELEQKPRSFQDLQPAFMREIQNWAKHEKTVELKEILRQNCIYYDGSGPVPSQIHSYLSTNFKELRNLTKDDPALITKAADRWYFPDPGKQVDLDKIREKSLLSEFEQYKASKERKLKLFRTEAVRAGFKAAYEAQDYKTIVGVAAKLPENVLQEDEKLLMYYDVASMRLGDE